MQTVSKEFLFKLMNEDEQPCLSLYQTTHRSHPDKTQDPIRFKNLVKKLEASLAKSYSETQSKKLLAPFKHLTDDADFWRHTLDGLVVLSNEDTSHVLRLQRAVPDFAVVSDSWHIKPLVRATQTADQFQVLCVTRNDVHLFEGNRNVLDEVPLAADVPETITEALGDQLTEPYQHISSPGRATPGGNGGVMRHGHGGKSDEIEGDILRFFRIIDSSILEHHSQSAKLPLILVTLPEYQGVFRQLSNNPFLLPNGIDIDPAALTAEQLRQRAWEVIKPTIDARVSTLKARFKEQHGTGRASDLPDAILAAATAGRVETLLVDADRRIPGRLDHAEQRIELAEDFTSPEVEDVLDDMAEFVMRRGGEAMVIPSELMPSDTGLAAIYRY